MFNEYFTNSKVEKLNHNQPNEGVFFTPNGYTGARKKDTNLTHVNAVWADWDFKPQEGQPTGSAKPDFKQFMLDLDGLPTPTFIVESGNGWHLYWLLDEPIVVDDSNRAEMIKQVEGIHRFIHTKYNSDSGAMDALRLMRLPGHLHLKQPEHPFMVTVIEDNEDTRYTWEEILEAMPPVYKEAVEHVPSTGEDYSVRQAAIDAWAEKGDTVSFDSLGRMVWNGQPTGTFIGRSGTENYIATTSDEFPYKGNATTYVAGVLGITTKAAYKWLVEKYGELLKTTLTKSDDTTSAEDPEERTRYFEHLAVGDWDDKDWVKKLKALRESYFINFYKRIAQLYPHLKYAIDIEGLFWDYQEENGVYKELGFQSVRSMVLRALRDDELDVYTTDTHVKRILANFITDAKRGVCTDSFTGDDDYLHVKNGWLHLKTLELLPHTPERLSLATINVPYEASATCPIYDKMITEFRMPDDQVRVIDQYSGLSLTNDISHQEMLVFEGRPGSGKSLITETWMQVLGHKSGSEKLTMLRGDAERFMGESLVGKTLLFFDEANPKTENINESFMKFVSEKTIKVERKGQNKRELVRNTLKVVLALNEMPYHFPPGFDRRYRHILFTRSFRDEGTEDKTLFDQIAKNELPGVLNRMLRGLHDLQKMGRTTIIAGETERKRNYSLAADDLSAFVSDYFEPDPTCETVVNGKLMLSAFKEEHPTSFNKGLSQHAFAKKLQSIRLAEFSGIKKDRTKEYRGYTGLKLKEGFEFNDWGKIVENNSVTSEF